MVVSHVEWVTVAADEANLQEALASLLKVNIAHRAGCCTPGTNAKQKSTYIFDEERESKVQRFTPKSVKPHRATHRTWFHTLPPQTRCRCGTDSAASAAACGSHESISCETKDVQGQAKP